MHHITQKKKLPPMRTIPQPKPPTRELPQKIIRPPKINYDVSPLFETIHLIVTGARKKYPGLLEFCGQEKFTLWCDHFPHDQIIITSACLDNKAYQQWLKEDHFITLKRYTQTDKKNNIWRITQNFIMSESGYPFSYKEYNKEIDGYDSLPTGSIKIGGRGVVIHRENIEIVYKLATEFNTYLLQNKYPQKVKFSGPIIDRWGKEQQHVRRN